MSEHRYMCDVFDGREVPCDDDGASPDINRQPFVPGKLDQEVSGPEQCPCSFDRYGHDKPSQMPFWAVASRTISPAENCDVAQHQTLHSAISDAPR